MTEGFSPIEGFAFDPRDQARQGPSDPIMEELRRLREVAVNVARDLSAAMQALERRNAAPTLMDAAEMLWITLANVSGGDWTQQTPEWQAAAARYRDQYFEALRQATATNAVDPIAQPSGTPPPRDAYSS